ncbi:hypothetical protein HID58_037743 [Brassica napus]|uniref:RRM domain-containing protein n=1 Tax=Brassica napus TaxID=3708 RepID=A0ABQ8BP07_BRANA|nr:hypothetical protein HID58_037743 [Brassica napus]
MLISLFDYEEEENQSKTFASPLLHQQPQGMMTLYTPTFLVSHHMMYASPPPPLPYSPNDQYLSHNQNHESPGVEYQNTSNSEKKTIWIGDLHNWMDENYLKCSFASVGAIFVGGLDSSVTSEDLKQPFSAYGEIVSVNIPLGKECGFVQFVNRQNAEEALKKLNGTVIRNRRVRLAWGQNKLPRYNYGNQWFGAYFGRQHYNGYGYMVPQPHDPRMYAVAPYGGYPVYSDPQQQVDKKTLPSTWELNDHRLKTSETFVLLKAKNVCYNCADSPEEENQSKTFASPRLHQQPQGMMTLYTPTFLVSHHMMYASPPPPLPYSPNDQYLSHNQNHESPGDEYQNTSNSEKKTIWIGDLHNWMDENYLKCSFASVGAIFVGGLDSSVTSEDLKQPFSAYGEIVSVNIPLGKECGFVQFVNRQNAEEALKKLNGTVIRNRRVRLAWGQNKLPRYNYGNQWFGAYFGGQHYNGYGYMVPQPHDPRMYAVAPYGGYPVYSDPQQQVSRGN